MKINQRHTSCQSNHIARKEYFRCRLPSYVLPSKARQLQHKTFASPDTEEARSPLDAPQEWEAPMPSRRPDIFPEFDKPERVFLPKPLPGDPEMPDEELEEAAKRIMPGDPDPEQKPGEPPEEPEKPADPSAPEPEKKTDIPSMPE
ncbi:hypothetical protein CEUSTIGMA_g4558.t1 [Chlamydomonas eustigma]|uniref:Uncharacterized protein n=1 Tax=Chlamydomonas eustigma TaxID=1157962 RepID=A0A250X2J6_9CHLO|nr:hypothetical protein CEUSTIGMA_g4558.t1 [Chlamydomonas eustigma]|eukprot:GAX77112.1 hypothetical protein CEUSTIGMA_g4558.t1 [Chlamydomonas eustigma]